MKLISYRLSKLDHSFLFRQPEGAEGAEQLSQDKPQTEIDPAQVAREGMRGVNAQIDHIGELSPAASQIIGEQLPSMIGRGLNSPADAARLGEAADEARTTITAQLAEDGAEAHDYPPEAYAEVTAWLDEVQTQMAAAQVELAAQVEAHPDNAELAQQKRAFDSMVTEVSQLQTTSSNDLSTLEQQALEGGVTGPLATRLAQVAQGEVGAANSDAEGNAKYSGGVDQPWCADFVNYCLQEAGGKGTGSSMAQSFVQGEGKGHVAIVATADGGTIGGNEGNAVKAGGNASSFEKAISAEDVSAGRFDQVKSASEAGVGDIVVRSRQDGSNASAADQNVA